VRDNARMLLVDLDPATRIATLTLDRPEKRNALSTELMDRLTCTLREIGERSDVGVVILTANGRVFSAGHDIAEMVDRSLEDYQHIFDTCTELMETIQAIPQPVIAMVRGVATAAGCQLVASCDLAFAEDTASFGTTGIQIGLFCSTPSVAVSRNLGRKRALQLLLTGETIDATTAVDWGLINEALPAEQLEARTREIAEQILRWSPLVVGLGKQGFYSQIEMDQHRAYDHMKAVMSMNALAEDAHEGMTAFLEKRRPAWKSR
jgi:enoyl-CoA hydratase/carnithine racemase